MVDRGHSLLVNEDGGVAALVVQSKRQDGCKEAGLGRGREEGDRHWNSAWGSTTRGRRGSCYSGCTQDSAQQT